MKGTGPDLDRLARTEDAIRPFILTFSAPETTSCAPTAAGAHEPAPYPERVSLTYRAVVHRGTPGCRAWSRSRTRPPATEAGFAGARSWPTQRCCRRLRGVVPLTFRLPGSSREIDVDLSLKALRSLVGELREASTTLADAVDLAGRGETSRIVILREGDQVLLSVAARLVEEKHLVDDLELSKLAEL